MDINTKELNGKIMKKKLFLIIVIQSIFYFVWSQPYIKNIEIEQLSKKEILIKWKKYHDSTSNYAQFTEIDTLNYIQYNTEKEIIKGRFVVESVLKIKDKVYLLNGNQVKNISVYSIVVRDQWKKYTLISQKENKTIQNEDKIKLGDTLELEMSNIFGLNLFYCTNQSHFSPFFDFIYKNMFFNNMLLKSYYISTDINGIYIDKSKVSNYLMYSCIYDENGKTLIHNDFVNTRTILDNWEKLNVNQSFTILNTDDSFSYSDFYETKDTIYSDFLIENISMLKVYTKGILNFKPVFIHVYILKKDEKYYFAYSTTKIKNSQKKKIKKGEIVKLKIVNIFPIKNEYYPISGIYDPHISFIIQGLYFKNVSKNTYYQIID
jgi:hypothetical protein